MGDLGQARAEGLLRAGPQLAAPFAAVPERALAVVGLAFLRRDEMQRAHAERRGLLQDFSRGLRAGQADHQRQGIERRGLLAPGEGELEGVGADRDQRAPAARPVDQPGVEARRLRAGATPRAGGRRARRRAAAAGRVRPVRTG